MEVKKHRQKNIPIPLSISVDFALPGELDVIYSIPTIIFTVKSLCLNSLQH